MTPVGCSNGNLLQVMIPAGSAQEHPPDYDYPGFSRGSSYHEKQQSGELDDENDGYVGNEGADGHKNDDEGHCKLKYFCVDMYFWLVHELSSLGVHWNPVSGKIPRQRAISQLLHFAALLLLFINSGSS